MFDYIYKAQKRYRKKTEGTKIVFLDLIECQNTDAKDVYILDATREGPSKKFDFKHEVNRFVKRLARSGLLSFLNAKEKSIAEKYGKLPKKLIVDFRIPPVVGGCYTADNLCITTADVSSMMDELYWKQVSAELNSFIYHKPTKEIAVRLTPIPPVFLMSDFLKRLQPHEHFQIKAYLARKEKWREKAQKSVAVQKTKNSVVLRMNKREALPPGFKRGLIKARSLSSLERARVKQEYLHCKGQLVLKSLEAGYFDRLPKNVRKKIAQTERVPAEAQLACHHVIPRSLGGENVFDNICWLPVAEHLSLHKKYIDPLITYYDTMIAERRSVFLEIPVPENTNLPLYIISSHGKVILYSEWQKQRKKHKRTSLRKKLNDTTKTTRILQKIH